MTVHETAGSLCNKDSSNGSIHFTFINCCIVFTAIFFLIFLRNPDSLTHAQFWAEDGIEWFKTAYLHPEFKTIFWPYNGYMNVAPRAIAYLTVTMFSLEHAPFVFNLVATLIATSTVWFFTLPYFRHIVPHDYIRIAAACLIAAAHPAGEIIGSLTNIHWNLTILAVLLAVIPVQLSRFREVCCILVLLICGMSAPLMIAFVPLLLLVSYLKLIPASRLRVIVFFLSIALQHICIRISSARKLPVSFSLDGAVESVVSFFEVLLGYLYFAYEPGAWLERYHYTLYIVALSFMTIYFLYCWSRNYKRHELLIFTSVLATIAGLTLLASQIRGIQITSLSAIAANIPVHGAATDTLENYWVGRIPDMSYSPYVQSRYLFMPFCLLVACVASITSRVLFTQKHQNIVAGILPGLVFILSSIHLVSGEKMGPYERYNWKYYAKKIEQGWRGPVPILPHGWQLTFGSSDKGSKDRKSILSKLLQKQSERRKLVMITKNGRRLPAFFQHAPDSTSIVVKPQTEFLEFYYGLDPAVWNKSDGVSFVMRVCPVKKGTCQEVLNHLVQPAIHKKDRKLHHAVISLKEFTKRKSLRLEFQVNMEHDQGYDWALWVNPQWIEQIMEDGELSPEHGQDVKI